MKKRGLMLWSLMLAGSMLIMSSCQSEYDKMRHRELASGVRHDSLFFGIYMGMPSEDFFARCLSLNRQRILTNNSDGRRVQCFIKGEDPQIIMNFYPNFKENQIREMPVDFHYASWSPWNKHLWADKLLPKMVSILERWYGKGFIKMEDKERGVIYVKIDGNRQIVIGAKDDQFVKANFTDLTNPIEAEEVENVPAIPKPKTTSQTAR